jgi:hypothetical protein
MRRYRWGARAVTHARVNCDVLRFNAAMNTLPRAPYIVAYVAFLVIAVCVAVMAVQPSKRDLSKLAGPGSEAYNTAASAIKTHPSFSDSKPAAPTSALTGSLVDPAVESPTQVVAQRRK